MDKHIAKSLSILKDIYSAQRLQEGDFSKIIEIKYRIS